MSLKEPRQKMSKSHPDPRSRILLTDSAATIRQKVALALTDSEPGIWHDPATRPGVSNLLELMAHVDSSSIPPVELASSFKGTTMRAFKEHVASRIDSGLADVRDRLAQIMEQDDKKCILQEVACQGASKARSNSAGTLDRVHQVLGVR